VDHATLSLVILGMVIALFVWNRLPVEIVAVGTVAADDVIVVRGDAESVSRIVVDKCLAVGTQPMTGADGATLLSRELGVAEVVVPPRSALIGQTVFPGMVRDDEQVILAVHRLGRDRGPAPTMLDVGDTLLIQGPWDALGRTTEDPDVLVVDSPDLVRQAYRAISWTVVVLIAGMIPLSTAIEQTGAADKIAHVLITVVGHHGPYVLMIGLFLVTGVLGQVISNTATALIMIPVAGEHDGHRPGWLPLRRLVSCCLPHRHPPRVAAVNKTWVEY
jgi:hypothetical protein